MLHIRNVVFLFFIVTACNQNNNIENIPNTPTTGRINVLSDNTFQYIVPPQINLFTSIYKNAEVNYKFKPEQECIQNLLNDSCKLILISRKLSDKELKVFENKNLIIKQTPVAYSAVAVLGKPFKEKGMTIEELKNILIGSEEYKVIFFKKSNGALLYCKDSLLQGNNFGKNCFITEDSVIFRNHIHTQSKTIGIIDYSFICDDDDKWTQTLKYPDKDTLIIPLRKNKNMPAYYPDQSNIATKDYPLTRTIYCIRRGDNFSLSAGLEAFLAGEKGQILFKKMGLVPTIDRERRIEIKPY